MYMCKTQQSLSGEIFSSHKTKSVENGVAKSVVGVVEWTLLAVEEDRNRIVSESK